MSFDYSLNLFNNFLFFTFNNKAVHWLFLAYGIVALGHHYALLAFVPFPSIFYILTVRFTDPTEFRDREERAN